MTRPTPPPNSDLGLQGQGKEVISLGKSLQGTETILLVEDEEDVRTLIQDVLQRSGYTVLVARQGEDALQIIEEHQQAIHLLLIDVIVPGELRGYQLAERLTSLSPDMKTLYISGYADNTIIERGGIDSSMAFLQKPFTPNALLKKVRTVLEE